MQAVCMGGPGALGDGDGVDGLNKIIRARCMSRNAKKPISKRQWRAVDRQSDLCKTYTRVYRNAELSTKSRITDQRVYSKEESHNNFLYAVCFDKMTQSSRLRTISRAYLNFSRLNGAVITVAWARGNILTNLWRSLTILRSSTEEPVMLVNPRRSPLFRASPLVSSPFRRRCDADATL